MSYVVAKRSGLHSTFSFEVWSLAIVNNLDHFFFFKAKYWYSEKFVYFLDVMLDHVQYYEVEIKKLEENIDRFNVDPLTPGNGFRSFEIIFERLFNECYNFCKELCTVRDSIFFMPGQYLKRLEAYVNLLKAIKPALTYVLNMLNENTSDKPLVVTKNITAEEIIMDYGLLDQVAFYGRLQSFYFCGSFQKILWGVGVIVASFSDLYRTQGGPLLKAISAVSNGVKYILYPELRARQIVSLAQNSSIEFLQAFWRLSEIHFMKVLPRWICPSLEVIEDLWIPPEPINILTEDGSKTVQILPPSSHIPTAPVRCLLMSYVHRKGQFVKGKYGGAAPFSSALLFHCHGGGFVSQTPESHEIYLRHWAKDLNIPILSVDYSLAPQAPFPRALEEVLIAYVWALKNPEKLGWTGERICFVGDSAGGNIILGITIKTISLNIRRPDAVIGAYCPLLLDLVPSPSHLLCWVDPLLPIGFMISCLDAYVGAMHTDNNEYSDAKSKKERKTSSLSEIIGCSRMFFKDIEWGEIEANEPEVKESISEMKTFSPASKLVSDSLQNTDCTDNSSTINYYVNNFFHSYRHLLKTDIDDTVNDDRLEHLIYNFPQDFLYDVKDKYTNLLHQVTHGISGYIQRNNYFKKFVLPFVPTKLFSSNINQSLQEQQGVPVAQKIRRLKLVSKNPYISPLLASDEILKQMPQIYFISLNFDPCLDDSITFAKRLSEVGKPAIVDVLDGLPHGFLNFLPFSKEAHDGSDLFVKRIKEALKL